MPIATAVDRLVRTGKSTKQTLYDKFSVPAGNCTHLHQHLLVEKEEVNGLYELIRPSVSIVQQECFCNPYCLLKTSPWGHAFWKLKLQHNLCLSCLCSLCCRQNTCCSHRCEQNTAGVARPLSQRPFVPVALTVHTAQSQGCWGCSHGPKHSCKCTFFFLPSKSTSRLGKLAKAVENMTHRIQRPELTLINTKHRQPDV